MALGRHSAVPVKRQKPAYELLAWGGFVSVACAASLWILDLGSAPGLVLSAMPAAAFTIVWFLGRDTPSPRPAPSHSAATSRRRDPAPAAQPGQREGQPVSEQPTQAPLSPVTHAATAESRWVKEFGPPATGPLPVRAYRRGQAPGVFAGSVEQRAGGRQWSHSRA
ncbi:hypothetical protein [Arthrobacter sp. CAN_A1]|uniref:hypothetical protein n=1 Tax=Arthrobacter sp. CAN_A1 TaxID=2787717 RepID=UPI0018CAEB6C